MRLVDELLRLSATDLANHLGCIHLSELNRAAAQGLVRRPRWADPLGELLRERGHEHEKAYLAHLRAPRSLKHSIWQRNISKKRATLRPAKERY